MEVFNVKNPFEKKEKNLGDYGTLTSEQQYQLWNHMLRSARAMEAKRVKDEKIKKSYLWDLSNLTTEELSKKYNDKEENQKIISFITSLSKEEQSKVKEKYIMLLTKLLKFLSE